MVAVVSQGTLTDAEFWSGWRSSGSVQTAGGAYKDYATLYREQPSVRTAIDFIARNVAQLGLHTYRRVSDTDRVRLTEHPLARLIERPNAFTTRYRLVESLMIDLGIYWNAYWAKLAAEDGVTDTDGVALLRVPPQIMSVKGGLVPTLYTMSIGGRKPIEIDPSAIVHFRGHNPDSPLIGLSDLDTLGSVLREEDSTAEYRGDYLDNAARASVIIKRPAGAPAWGVDAAKRFREDFEAMYTRGKGGRSASGRTAIFQEGMDVANLSFNPEQGQFAEGRRHNREEITRAKHVPLPMVGILDHATFSNVREQHKNLYQDCLGPWLEMVTGDIELQLLPEFDDRKGVYVEFNIDAKLAGSFEEQADALNKAVGRPWMTPNEARALRNMPSLGGDADELGSQQGVSAGGAPPQAILDRTFARQRAAVVKRLTNGAATVADAWDTERWDRELTTDLGALGFGAERALSLARMVNADNRAALTAEQEAEHAPSRN